MKIGASPFEVFSLTDYDQSLELYTDVRLELIERCRQELLIVNWVKRKSIFNIGVKFLTGGDAGHTSVIVPEILPNGKSADSLMHVQAVGRGVEKARVSHEISQKDYAIVYRVPTGSNLSDTYNRLVSLVDKKYDFAQIAFIAAAVGAQRLIGTDNFWQMFTGSRLNRWYEKETVGTYICSEVASIALRDYGAESKWPSDRPVGFINPNNLVNIFNLQEIMRFKT